MYRNSLAAYMHLCFQRPTEAEGIDLEYRVKNIKFSWTLISLTMLSFFTQWCISEAHFVWSLQRHQMISLCHSVNFKCRINKPLWPNTHSFPQNIFVTHNGQACKFLPNFQRQWYNYRNELITKTIERLIPCLQQFWQMLTIFIPVVGWYFWTKWAMLGI